MINAIEKFPPNPVDGMIVEVSPGIYYQYDKRTATWVHLEGFSKFIDVANPQADGLMSKNDFKKIYDLLLPPPKTTIGSKNCGFVFDTGIIGFHSFDNDLFIDYELDLYSKDSDGNTVVQKATYKIHENTYGINFRVNLEKLIYELNNRGNITYRKSQGPPGLVGPRGKRGRDNIDTGPVGARGPIGKSVPWPFSLTEDTQAKLALNGRGVVDVSEERVSPTENYLVVTRANIGNFQYCPEFLKPTSVQSPWILVIDERQDTIIPYKNCLTSTELCSSEFCTTKLIKYCATKLYYIDISDIEESIKERFNVLLAQLKASKEKLVQDWLKVMMKLFADQKRSVCCATQNTLNHQANRSSRERIEEQRIQAAQHDMQIILGLKKDAGFIFNQCTGPVKSESGDPLGQYINSDSNAKVGNKPPKISPPNITGPSFALYINLDFDYFISLSSITQPQPPFLLDITIPKLENQALYFIAFCYAYGDDINKFSNLATFPQISFNGVQATLVSPGEGPLIGNKFVTPIYRILSPAVGLGKIVVIDADPAVLSKVYRLGVLLLSNVDQQNPEVVLANNSIIAESYNAYDFGSNAVNATQKVVVPLTMLAPEFNSKHLLLNVMNINPAITTNTPVDTGLSSVIADITPLSPQNLLCLVKAPCGNIINDDPVYKQLSMAAPNALQDGGFSAAITGVSIKYPGSSTEVGWSIANGITKYDGGSSQKGAVQALLQTIAIRGHAPSGSSVDIVCPILATATLKCGVNNSMKSIAVDLPIGRYILEASTCCCLDKSSNVWTLPVVVNYESLEGRKSLDYRSFSQGPYADENLAFNDFVGSTIQFEHQGGTIYLWVDGNNFSGNSDIVILFRDADCVDASDACASGPVFPINPASNPSSPDVFTCSIDAQTVQWYEAGWRTGACCGAWVTAGGQDWIVVKRSIGADPICGGGEHVTEPCIAAGLAVNIHPCIAFPTYNGMEFLGAPTSSQDMIRDVNLETEIMNKIFNDQVHKIVGDPKCSFEAILFPYNAS